MFASLKIIILKMLIMMSEKYIKINTKMLIMMSVKYIRKSKILIAMSEIALIPS